MCIAIVKTKDSKAIDEKYLRNSFQINSDGAGIAYISKGNLYIIKGIFDEDKFVETVRKVEEISEGAMLIHCRIGTSGLKDKDNTHPFIVNDKTVMIHNGILDIDVPKGSKKSDTAIFCDEILSKLPDNFIYNEGILKLIEITIGSSNKFAFLDTKGNYVIVNEKAGIWEDGIWYSNTSYKSEPFVERKHYGYGNYGWDNYGYADYGRRWWEEYDDVEYTKSISKNQKKKLKNKILNLTDDELYDLGDYPIYDITNKSLIGEHSYTPSNWLYLEEVDYDLQQLYEDLRETRLTA